MKQLKPSQGAMKQYLTDYSLIVVGAFLHALSYVLFIAPYKIVPGGVYGISIVLYICSTKRPLCNNHQFKSVFHDVLWN